MRTKLLIAIAFVALAVLGTPALADGPSGSKENGKNEVTCNKTSGPSGTGGNVYASGNSLYLGSGGAEVCSDDNSGADGRVIVSSSGYAAIDGDSSNPAGNPQGWARLDSGGPTTGSEKDAKTRADNDATCKGDAKCK